MARPTEVELLDVVAGYIERGEKIPRLEQIATDLNRSAKSHVSELMNNLENAGFITSEKSPTGRRITRTIRLANTQSGRLIPVLGRVAAGLPILADRENISEFVPLPANRVRGAGAYMLRVSGDSMIGDGIFDRDYVIVVRGQEVRDGDIAVVLLGEEATIKHVWREGDSIRLVSSNQAVGDQTYGASDFPDIQGKVIGVIRWLQ